VSLQSCCPFFVMNPAPARCFCLAADVTTAFRDVVTQMRETIGAQLETPMKFCGQVRVCEHTKQHKRQRLGCGCDTTWVFSRFFRAYDGCCVGAPRP
jgi:hypothetical protein